MKSIIRTLPLHMTVYAVGLFAVLAIYAVASVVLANDNAFNTEQDYFIKTDSVDICHSAKGKNYTPKKLSVNVESIVKGTSGHDEDDHDVIPAFYWSFDNGSTTNYYAGKNWPELQYLWNDEKCGNEDQNTVTTGTVKVIKSFAQQTEHTWSDFSFTVNDGPETFFNSSGVGEVEIEAGSYTVTEVPFDGYTPTYTGDCSGELEVGETATCYIENSVAPTEPKDSVATVIAEKIVCDAESYLPDWGTGQGVPEIDEDTVDDFLSEGDNGEHCRLVNWDFEWAPPSAENPGDNNETAGEPWTVFSGAAQIEIQEDWKHVWVREVPNSGYIPFTGKEDTDPVSAEMYCNVDSFHYDNYERIDDIAVGETYYCVAWNVPVESEEPEMCVISSDETTLVDGVPSTLTWVHPNWTTELASGEAEWVWDDSQEPRDGETVTFTKTFNVDNSPTSATLKVATDNSYVASLNGNLLSCDGSGSANYSSIDTCSASVVAGVNTLTFVATNDHANTNNEQSNPAGLIYELTIDGSACSAVPEEPTTYPITGSKWDDTDGDGEWDEGELGIENWGIVVRPMTLKPFDTLFVPATDDSITTSASLTDGQYYLVEVSGTYKFANWSPYGIADAEWSYRSAPYTPDNIAGWVKGEGYFQSECGLDLQMNGCFDWGLFNETNNHLYKTVVQGDGTPLEFSIYDNQYGDNEGGLTVEIYDVTDYITYTDEDGQYSVDVEEGDYQIVEIMQEGWEQTYPSNPSYYHVTVPNDNEMDYDFGNSVVRPEDQDLETITICSVDGTEDQEEGVPYSGLTVLVSNGEEGVTHELVTEGDDGCVSIDVDPNEGPWYVTQNLFDPWFNLRVEVYGGVYYYGSELFTVQDVPFTLIPRAHAQSFAVAQQTVLGCTFSTSFTTGALCRFVNAQTQSSPSNAVSSSVGGGSCIGCGSSNGNNGNGGGNNSQPQGQTQGASDSRDGSSSSSNGNNKPEGEVQGAQTTIIPAGAPNAGGGGMSPTNNTAVPFMALLGMFASVAMLRMTRVNA